MLRIFWRLGLVVLFALASFTIYKWVQDFRSSTAQNASGQATISLPPTADSLPDLTMLVVQINADEAGRRVLHCTTQGCQPVDPPSSMDKEALSDGQSWYHYETAANEAGKEIVALRRTWKEDGSSTGSPQGRSDTIVQETTLVRPRDMYISADGNKVAYWLDNITNNQGLTEIWMYDAAEEGTRLLAENLVSPDVLTRLRWNTAGTALWFLADNAEERGEEKRELVVVRTAPPEVRVRFTSLDVETVSEILDRGVMDLNAAGDTLAYTQPIDRSSSKLVTLRDGEEPQEQIIRGHIPYIQWLEDNSLLYAIQSGNEFIFWRAGLAGAQDTPIARATGVLRSARGDSAGSYVAFLAESKPGQVRAHALQTDTGVVRDQGGIPSWGRYVHLVYAQAAQDAPPAAVAGIVSELSDGELLAFIQNRIGEMVRIEGVKLKRVVATEMPNTVYVDYDTGGQQLGRLLVTVKNAINSEWTIRGRYEPAGGEWQKVQGGGLKDPEPRRVYEWEEGVRQWILKQEVSSKN